MTKEEFDNIKIGEKFVWSNGRSFRPYTITDKDPINGYLIYEDDDDVYYTSYERAYVLDKIPEGELVWDEKLQYKNSITLAALKDVIDAALKENPSYGDKMVYMDGLALLGRIEKIGEEGEILELI